MRPSLPGLQVAADREYAMLTYNHDSLFPSVVFSRRGHHVLLTVSCPFSIILISIL